jgi:hypothetical protein
MFRLQNVSHKSNTRGSARAPRNGWVKGEGEGRVTRDGERNKGTGGCNK